MLTEIVVWMDDVELMWCLEVACQGKLTSTCTDCFVLIARQSVKERLDQLCKT